MYNSNISAKQYIRFGEIPSDERSCEYHSGRRAKSKLPGVCVLDAAIIDGVPRIVVPTLQYRDIKTRYLLGFIRELFRIKDQNVYLVEGDVVGKGPIEEPLLRNIKVIKDITKEIYKQTDDRRKRYLKCTIQELPQRLSLQ